MTDLPMPATRPATALWPLYAVALGLVALAVLGPALAPHDPIQIAIMDRLSGPSATYPLGTDAMGRCILSRLLHGARWSLGLAFLISLIGLLTGTLIGILSASTGRWGDALFMRMTDTFLAFPELIAAVVIAGLLGPGIGSLVLSLSLVGWMRYARVTRGLCLNLNNRDYMVQARLSGLSARQQAKWHYAPALAPTLIVLWSLMFGRSILAISGLGFLGFGVQPPMPEWGTLLLDGKAYLRSEPQLMLWPGLAILITVLIINLTGDRLRDHTHL